MSEEGVKLKCPFCGNTWTSRPTKSTVTCSDCLRKIKVKECIVK